MKTQHIVEQSLQVSAFKMLNCMSTLNAPFFLIIFVEFRMFILADTEERCVLITVYYVDISTSVSLGDIIEIPKPVYRLMNIEWRKEVQNDLFFFAHKRKILMIFSFWRNSQFHQFVLIHRRIWKSTTKIGRWILMHRLLFHSKWNFKQNLKMKIFITHSNFFWHVVLSCVLFSFLKYPSIHSLKRIFWNSR